MMSRAAAVADLAGFRLLTEPQKQRVCDASALYALKPKVTLFEARAQADSLVCVLSGTVEAFGVVGQRRSTIGQFPSGFFPLASIVLREDTLYSLATVEPTQALIVPANLVRTLLSENQQFGIALLAEVARSHDDLMHEFHLLSTQLAATRLVHWLYRQINSRGIATGIMRLNMPKRSIASAINVAPEMLKRVLSMDDEWGVTPDVRGLTVDAERFLAAFGRGHHYDHLLDGGPHLRA